MAARKSGLGRGMNIDSDADDDDPVSSGYRTLDENAAELPIPPDDVVRPLEPDATRSGGFQGARDRHPDAQAQALSARFPRAESPEQRETEVAPRSVLPDPAAATPAGELVLAEARVGSRQGQGTAPAARSWWNRLHA